MIHLNAIDLETIKQQIEKQVHPGFVSDKFYTYPGITSISNRNDCAYANNLYFNYLYLPKSVIIDILFQIISGFVAGAKVQIGLYTIKKGLPLNKVFSKETIINNNGDFHILDNISIESGWYAIAYLTTDTMTIPGVLNTTSSSTGYTYGLTSVTSVITQQSGLRYNFTYANLPNIFNPANFTALSCTRSPVVYFRLD